ncbi:MAG: methyltransferase domain-containing protein [Vicinamibacterales bacterium]
MEELMENPNDAHVAAAKAYEALFVPAVFGQWASRVADAANLVAGERVLDVACGTGVLAREAHRRTGPTGYVAGVDPGVGMLAVAEELMPSVDWHQGTAEALPFSDATFDVVVSQFGLMFMERDRAIREMLRVLKTNGRLVGGVGHCREHAPRMPPRSRSSSGWQYTGRPHFAPLRARRSRTPRQAFNHAGAGAFTISTATGVARFPSIQVMVSRP